MLYIQTLILISFFSLLLIAYSNIQAQSFLKSHATECRTGNIYHFALDHYSDSTKTVNYDYKNQVTAGVLSFAVPGLALGQFYNGQKVKAFVHIGISVGAVLIGSLISRGHPDLGGIYVGSVVYLLNWTWSICDAILSATIINQENELLKYKRKYK